MTRRNLYYNYTGYPNYYEDGGLVGRPNGVQLIPIETKGISPSDTVNSNAGNRDGDNKFLNFMNGSGGGWAAAIGPAATNIANAFTDTESSTAERVAGAMGIPVLAKQWTADTTKGDKYLKGLALQNTGIKKPNYIQDASSAWGANNAIKLNAQNNISPISSESALPSLKDFKGNWWRNTGAAVAQGAAAGSVGGPWGALGGAVTGLLGSIGGLFGRQKRANAAYKDFLARRDTLMSARQAQFNKANIDQTLSNMQALANGNVQQRINDMANIRAYGGNLFDDGGDLTDEQQMVLADIQADPRILFTPKYSQWRDYIRRTSPNYLDRLYASLPYEQQQDIYQNDREAWGALSNEAKGNFGGTQVRKKTDEVSPYVAGALGLVGAIPAWEAVTMFPMLENGLNAYFGYEGAKNLPTAVTDAYDYAKKGDWSRAGLSAGEAVLDGMFIGNGIKGVKNLSELSGLSDRIYNTFPILDPYTTSGATFGYHGTSALDRLLGTISRRNGFTYKPEIPEFHRRLRINEPNDMRFDENGNFILSSGRTGEGHDGIVNFATSEPARGHRSHKTLSGIDDYIVNPEALKNQEFISIEPSDTFFETSELSINPKDITLVSGDTKLLDYAKSKGFNTLSSPRLREYYRKNHAKPTTSGKNSNKLSITKEGADVSPRDVGDEIQRLTSKRGAPTLEDYRFFENETGLPSGVVPIEEYNTVGQQALYGHSPSLRANLNWNNVAYDPATQVESLYRKAKINPDDAEAVKKYNDYIDNLKRINNNTEYAMGGNLYTDLSPNMMSLWNNKQQIDQQKVNMQQMNFGLGNSFNQKLNTFDYGGSMNGMDLPTGMQSYENGGTHEQNPYGGIQVGVDQQGNPNLVEEGEFRWGDYVFSDRINVDPTLLSRYNLAPATKHQGKKANKGKLSYADMAKKYAKKNGELANDPIGKNTLEAYMKRLQDAQEDQKFQDSMEQQKQDAINQYRNALTTPQQGNPLYGAMKYNGMGNAATQQGVNAGMSDLGQQGGGNEVLSNTNRSGNNMLHAMGGNLYPIGGWLGRLFGKKQVQDNNQNYGNEWRMAPQQDVDKYRPYTFEEILTYPNLGIHEFDNELRDKHHVQYDPFLEGENPDKNYVWGIINADYNNSRRYPDGMALPDSSNYYNPNDYFEIDEKGNITTLKYDENGNLISKWGYEPNHEPYPYKSGYNYRNTYRDFMDLTDYHFPGLQPMGSPAYLDVVRGQINWNPYKDKKPEDIIYSNINSDGQFSDPEVYSKVSPNNLPVIPGITPEEARENYEKYLNSLDIKGRQRLLVNHGYDLGTTGDNGDGVDGDWGNKSKAAWYDFNLKRQAEYNTAYNTSVNNFRQQTGWTDNNLNLGVREGDATTDNNNLGNGQTSYNNAEGNTNTGRSNLTDGIKRDTTTTFGTAATKGDSKQVPHYSTSGEYAMFGKGFTPMLYDWMNKTNTKYDPNQRPAYELADMGNNSTFLRTADTIGGYRAPNLMDAERMNNAAQAQGLAALQAALSVGNGNRGFAAAQANQQMYNTGMGIGNNYATAQQANNEERYKTDAYNAAIDQFNANSRNTSYQDNQKARQIGQQMAIDTKKAANDYILRNELYADATNRQAMDNRAANQATWTDNALNYFIAQAQKNDILNAKNNDITNPYWTDKNGVMHYIGDSGLNSAIYDAFTSDKDEWGNYAVNNGTFSGDRLKAWNALQEKYSAAYLKAHPELWKSLVLQEKQARKEEAEKAELAKTEKVANARYAFENNMAQLNNYRTIYGDKFKNSQQYDDLMKRYNDKANATEFNDINNLDYWNRIMGDEIDYWRRYNTPVIANQSAYGGYINNNNKSNKREYYNYMRR